MPLALACNAVALMGPLLAIARVRIDEPAPAGIATLNAAAFRAELCDGVRTVFGTRQLRAVALSSMTTHAGSAMAMAVLPIYLYRDLHLSPIAIGLVMLAGNAGLLASLVAVPLGRRLGVRGTLALTPVILGAGYALLPLALCGMPVLALLVARALPAFAGPIATAHQQGVRADFTGEGMQGRVSATIRTLEWGVLPAGALCGGALGTLAGAVPTFYAAAAICAAGGLWLLAYPCPVARGSLLDVRCAAS